MRVIKRLKVGDEIPEDARFIQHVQLLNSIKDKREGTTEREITDYFYYEVRVLEKEDLKPTDLSRSDIYKIDRPSRRF